jgi:hypothetical protein
MHHNTHEIMALCAALDADSREFLLAIGRNMLAKRASEKTKASGKTKSALALVSTRGPMTLSNRVGDTFDGVPLALVSDTVRR